MKAPDIAIKYWRMPQDATVRVSFIKRVLFTMSSTVARRVRHDPRRRDAPPRREPLFRVSQSEHSQPFCARPQRKRSRVTLVLNLATLTLKVCAVVRKISSE